MEKSSKPRFSLVIPTRERAYTLKYTLQTCLAQSFDNYEIVVCDNGSTEATKQVVDSFSSDRICYVRPDSPLAMSDNWELALSKATGEYVLILGDDDGILPDALSDIDRILRQTNAPVLRCDRLAYNWPDVVATAFTIGNRLRIPLNGTNQTVNGRSLIANVVNAGYHHDKLPKLYNSAVHSTIIQELRAKIGRVFAGRAPDVFSGIAIAYISEHFLSVGRPMLIEGVAGKSNGVATLGLHNNSPIAQDFHALNLSAGLVAPPTVPDLPTEAAELGINFQWAKQFLFPDDKSLCLDRKRLIVSSLNYLKSRTAEVELWHQYLEKIRVSLADDPKLLSWFESNYATSRPEPNPVPKILSRKVGFEGAVLHLDAAEFGVDDVMGAAEFSAKLLGPMDQLPTFGEIANTVGLKTRIRSAARILIKGS